MRRKLTLMAVLGAVAALVASAVWLTSASAITRAQDLTLFEGPDRETHLDMGREGPSQGDQEIFAAQLLDEHGHVIGRADGHCVLTDPRTDREVCVEIFTLERGTIIIEGSNVPGDDEEKDATSAITGGTGAYFNVRGQAHEGGAGHEEKIVLHLIP